MVDQSSAVLLAGGQSLVLALRRGEIYPKLVVDISRIESLSNICVESCVLSIGALSSHAAVSNSAVVRRMLPGLASMAGAIGDPAVRQRGTIAGALVVNDPRGDYPAALLALDATIRTTAGDFPVRMVCGAGARPLPRAAIVTDILVAVPQSFGYEKFRVPSFGNALVGVAISRNRGIVRVVVSGASPQGAFRWAQAEQRLGSDFASSALKGLVLAEDDLIGDFDGNPAYRAHLAGVMARRAVDAINLKFRSGG